jgi:hypothetical protein
MNREKYYDEHIAPKLLALAKECEEHGLSLLAMCEWAPGEFGRTVSLRKGAGFGIRLADTAVRANGNVDAMMMAIERYAREHGHSSIYLSRCWVPTANNATLGAVEK